jgi:hypothetical protein
MGKVSFDMGIDAVRGVLIGSDPFYIRRYKRKDGTVEFIVQARPDRSGHKATPAEAANREAFGRRYGTARRKDKNA